MCRVSRVRLRVWLVVDRARLRSDHRRRRRGCGCAIPASSPRRRRSRGASVVVDRVASSATLPCHTSWRPWSCRARYVRAPTGSTATTYHAMEPHTFLFILRYKCCCFHEEVFINARDLEAVLPHGAVPARRGRSRSIWRFARRTVCRPARGALDAWTCRPLGRDGRRSTVVSEERPPGRGTSALPGPTGPLPYLARPGRSGSDATWCGATDGRSTPAHLRRSRV